MRRTLAATAAVLLLGTLAACSDTEPQTHPAATHAASAPSEPAKASAPTKKPPTAEARKRAAAILTKEDAAFRAFLAEGQDTVGTPDFTAWYQKAVVGLDMQQAAFSKADGLFTADNEPTVLLEQWRSRNADANAAITQFAMDGTSADAPNAKTRADAATALKALGDADKAAAKIAAGG